MESGLPVDLDALIHARSVEDNRREFKAAWNPATQSSVVRTICAFANDLLNLNGGYVILGVEADGNGNSVLPPRGLESVNMDTIQRDTWSVQPDSPDVSSIALSGAVPGSADPGDLGTRRRQPPL